MTEKFTAQQVKDSTVQYQGDGVTITAYLVKPQGVSNAPSIIVIQEWWGLNDHIKDIARRLARCGYIAIAPDLYSRLGNPITTDADEAGRLMTALQQEDGLKDLNATIAYLKTVPEVDASRIGTMGFCMGGSYALILPTINASIKAAVSFYGQVPDPDTPLQKLHAPVLYIYGEDDGWITHDHVDRLRGALHAYGKTGEAKTYPKAPHAFFNDTRPDVYKSEEAADAWNRTLAFFSQHLGH
ncbi:MAG: carboxymethylenebutenolidase [Nitrospiraceae bacterium]|jgi:carboxymethylenebutenolidase|nr:carboxymethylenebutenolidase [Nitrospiraceae bacterium]|tara:strand:+ start:41 stop:763 length:723 start_codon:yes stop_codon:yes gene_type:complete